MSKKFDDNLFEDVPYDAPEMDDSLFEDVAYYEPEETGKLEAGVRGAAQGLTFDFADELQAALEATGKDIGSVLGLTDPVEGEEPVTFDEEGRPIIPESSGKYYKERLEDIRKDYKKAAEDQPVAYYGSDIAAGMLPALLTGGAGAAASIGKTAMKEGVKAAGKPALKAAKIGAGMGALTGAGISEADLTEGDVGGFAKDVAIGGISGAGLGAATPALTKVGGKVARKTGEIAKGITRALPGAEAAELAFKAGTKGIGVSQKAILDEAERVATKLNDKIMKVLAKSGVDRDKAVQLADEAGKRLNAGEVFDDILEDIAEKGAIGLEMKDKSKLYDNIASFKKGFEDQKIFKDLESKLAKQALNEDLKFGSELETVTEIKRPFGDILINPEGKGNVFGMRAKYSAPGPMGDKIEYVKNILKDVKDSPIKKVIYDLENAQPSEVKKILDYINKNLVGDMQKSPVGEEGTYRKLAVQLRELLDESVEEFADPTGTMKGIYRGAEELGIKEAGRGTQDAIEKNIKAIAKKLSSSGNASELDKRLAFRKFREASPEFADVIDEAEFISKLNDKLGGMTEGVQTTNIKGLIGTAEGSVAKIANVVGKGATAIQPVTQATKKVANKIMKYPEDKLQVASKWLNSKENKALNAMGQQLEYALQQEDGTIRNALIWSLSQQPAFRREVDKAIESQESQYMQDLGLQQSDFTEPPSSDIPFALPPEMEEEEDNVGRSPATVDDIDQEFILGQEGFETDGYVPVEGKGSNYTAISGSGKIAGNSGVTIASGLDLGQRDNLDDLNLPEDIKEKLIPYLGLKKEDAVNKLREMPLTLTEEEALSVKEATESSYYNLAESKFNKNKYGKEFTDLPPSVQTALYSLVYNTGTIGPNTLDKASNDNDYSDLLEELRNYYKEGSEADTGFQGQRRRLEADYIEQNLIEDIQKQKDRESKQLGSGAQAGTERSSLDDLMRSLNELRDGENEEMVAEMEDSAMAGDMNNLQELIDRLRMA
jgi:GH24 family phage-related lysozyme (muramidase)